MRAGVVAGLSCLALVVTGCGDLPRPFQPESKANAIDLRAYSARESLALMPPGGMSRDTEEDYLLALAEALVAAGIPVTGDNDAAGRRLITGIRPQDSGSLVHVQWRLIESDGKVLTTLQTDTPVARADWLGANPEVRRQLVEQVASALGQRLGTVPLSEAPPVRPARLALLPIVGAPGDGADSLERAIRRQLAGMGIETTLRPEAQDLLLAGTVEAAPPIDGVQPIRIDWTVLDAGDFSELGTITQENEVPAGSLDGDWGQTAHIVAQAVAQGLTDLLRQLEGRPTGVP